MRPPLRKPTGQSAAAAVEPVDSLPPVEFDPIRPLYFYFVGIMEGSCKGGDGQSPPRILKGPVSRP